jgi:transposase
MDAMVTMTPQQISVGPDLTREQAEAIFAQGQSAVVFAMLELSQRLAEAQARLNPSTTPSTPSGMIPTYEKPPASARGKKRPGAKPGHAGSRRKPPARIDRRETHRAEVCPECQGELQRCKETRSRVIEDIPVVEPVVTEHTIHRDYCPHCKKIVEPVVPDALPGATLGNRVLVLSAWLHYCLGNTLGQIVKVFNFHLQFPLSEGGLVAMWQRLQELLFAWYLEIQAQALDSAVLHADETGWRVNGKTHWLWCFSNNDVTYYMIDRSRGSPALEKFFLDEFPGILVSDFWGAYNAIVCADRQVCLVHLLRELEHTEKYKAPGQNWPEFAKKLRRLLADAIRLWKSKDTHSQDAYASRRARLTDRLQTLIETDWNNRHAKRLIKRLRRHQHDMFTFLDHERVPFDNNHAERAIRPAVILRKNSYGNRSQKGADCQAVLMSVFRTLDQRGLDPVQTLVTAIEQFLKTGQLPPIPKNTTSDG